MRDPHDVILRPILTEKSFEKVDMNCYQFYVAVDAGKIEIAKAIEAVFPGTKVKNVNTLRLMGKVKRQGYHSGRRPERKKAFVQLTEDSKTIELFEGM